MFLQKLILENVRSIQRVEMPCVTPDGKTRRWTIILGENGTGKSTLLRGAALLLAGSEALPELLGAPDAWISNGSEECRFYADLITAENEMRQIELRLRIGDTLREIFDRNRETLSILDNALAHSARNYLTVGYGVSRRINNSATMFTSNEVYRQPRAQSVATMFSPDATLNPLESWAIDLDYKRGKRGLEVVKNALEGLLPDATFHEIDREQKQLIFKTENGLVPLRYLSDGYQNVAAWCGDLLFRITQIFHDYKKPFSARGLLLIDEIDLHLHPVWKRQLVDFLDSKLPNFQFITTTHSALTAQQAGEGELFVLRRETPTSDPTLHAYGGIPRNLKLHQLLMSPLFGLETTDSAQVEGWRTEYKALEAKPTLTRTEKARFNLLQTQLEDLPDPTTESAHDRRQLELLEQIESALVTRKSGKK